MTMSEGDRQGLLSAYWPFKSIMDPDERAYVPRGAACVKISDALGRVGEKYGGLYAFGSGGDSTLPALPGLVVRDAGVIPIPLAESFASCLLDRCTQEDEEHKKRWKLQADQLWMKNPEWNRKVGELGVTTGTKLGFQEDVLLDVILSKLVVYAKGGYLNRTKEEQAEGQEDVVAKLVVQLPTFHTGGDLVVFDDEDAAKTYKFDFGKSTGTAAFMPSYAVFVAGAEYQVEEIKSGYQVVLEYSIRLPRDETMLMGLNRSRRFVQNELREAITEFGGTNESFALLLGNGYDECDDFEDQGSDRLVGIDRERFQALKKANGMVAPEKQLIFYFARLEHTVKVVKDTGEDTSALYRSLPQFHVNGALGPRWRIEKQSHAMVWFSETGEIMSGWDSEDAVDMLAWTSNMNFLNPEAMPPREMWGDQVCCSDLADGQTIEYDAYALVAWPVTQDLEFTTAFIGVNAALDLIVVDEPVRPGKLRQFMNMVTYNGQGTDIRSLQYMEFCENLCDAIVTAGEVELAWLFFIRYYDRLNDKKRFTPVLVSLVKTFSWGDVCVPLTNAIARMTHYDGMELALELVKSWNSGDAVHTALAKLAVMKAKCVPVEALGPFVGPLWKCTANCQDANIFTSLESLLQGMDVRELGPVIETVVECVNATSPVKQRAALFSLISVRNQWLNTEISRVKKPLTWEIPDARFPAHAGIEAFLRGPKASFVVSGFGDITVARAFIEKNQSPSTKSDSSVSFIMTAHGSGMNSMVIVTKTRDQREKAQKEVDNLNAELLKHKNRMKQISEDVPPRTSSGNGAGTAVGEKRPRQENPEQPNKTVKQRLEVSKGNPPAPSKCIARNTATSGGDYSAGA